MACSSGPVGSTPHLVLKLSTSIKMEEATKWDWNFACLLLTARVVRKGGPRLAPFFTRHSSSLVLKLHTGQAVKAAEVRPTATSVCASSMRPAAKEGASASTQQTTTGDKETCVNAFVSVCTCLHRRACVCVCSYMFVYKYLCIYIYIYIYI